MKGKLYSACVQSVMIFGSETWALLGSEGGGHAAFRENREDDG